MAVMKKRSHVWDYYKDGSRMSGLKIVDCKVQGTSQRRTVYNVSFDCCGARQTMTHERIVARISARHVLCGSCGQKRWSYYDPNTTIGGYRILKRIAVNGKAQRGTVYRVKAECCGAEIDVDHRRLRCRELNGSTLCPSCARKNGMEKYVEKNATEREKAEEARRERVATKRDATVGAGTLEPTECTPYGVDRYPDWPRPSWVPIGVNVIWQDRML